MSKVTTGFKCDPELRADLEHYAEVYGFTLSHFIENICSDHIIALETFDEYGEPETAPASENRYEDMLAPLFNRYQGQTITMRTPDGSVERKQVNHPIDVLEIVLSSVKTKP